MANRFAACTTVHAWQRGTTAVAGGRKYPSFVLHPRGGNTSLPHWNQLHFFFTSHVPKRKHHWAITGHYLHQSDEQQLFTNALWHHQHLTMSSGINSIKITRSNIKAFCVQACLSKSADSRGFGIDLFFPPLMSYCKCCCVYLHKGRCCQNRTRNRMSAGENRPVRHYI